MYVHVNWLHSLSLVQLQIAYYIDSFTTAFPSCERKSGKCFAKNAAIANALSLNESSVSTAISRMTTPNENGWRWLHEHTEHEKHVRRTMVKLADGRNELQEEIYYTPRIIRTIQPLPEGEIKLLYINDDWIPHFNNKTELAVAAYIHGFERSTGLCWATNRDIQKYLGFTASSISRAVKNLKKRGWLLEQPFFENGVESENDSTVNVVSKRRLKMQRIIKPFADCPAFAPVECSFGESEKVNQLVNTSHSQEDSQCVRVPEEFLQPLKRVLEKQPPLHPETNLPPLHPETDSPPLHPETKNNSGSLQGSNPHTPILFNSVQELQQYVLSIVSEGICSAVLKTFQPLHEAPLQSEQNPLHLRIEQLEREVLSLRTELQRLQSETTALQSETTALQSETTALQSETTALQSETPTLQFGTATILSSIQPQEQFQKQPEQPLSQPPRSLERKNGSYSVYPQSELHTPRRVERMIVPIQELNSPFRADAESLVKWLEQEHRSIFTAWEMQLAYSGQTQDAKRVADEMTAGAIKLLSEETINGNVAFVQALISKAMKDTHWKKCVGALTPKRLLELPTNTGIVRFRDLAERLKLPLPSEQRRLEEQKKAFLSMSPEDYEKASAEKTRTRLEAIMKNAKKP